MSTQTADLPDFFTGPQLNNPVAFASDVNVQRAAGQIGYGPFNCVGWDALMVSAYSTDFVDGIVIWYADPAATVIVGQQRFQSTANRAYVDTLPVVAPYCVLGITWHIGAGTVPTNLYIAPTRGEGSWKKPLDFGLLINDVGRVIGAGGNVTLPCGLHTTGRAFLTVNTDAAAWNGGLLPTTVAGVQTGQLALLGAPGRTPSNTVELSLPAVPVILFLQNGDAVPRTFASSLMLAR